MIEAIEEAGSQKQKWEGAQKAAREAHGLPGRMTAIKGAADGINRAGRAEKAATKKLEKFYRKQAEKDR
ncbi:hypothetical protein [Kribbella flavida]|uniref:hypothetical protein n=1 Tax=Kribbella flavida TaxID=182640 RepID=UPI0011D22215|nr:hypothetical protein [Kribbella flavida]